MSYGIMGMKWGVRKDSDNKDREAQMEEVLKELMGEQRMLKMYAENNWIYDEIVKQSAERSIKDIQKLAELLKGN